MNFIERFQIKLSSEPSMERNRNYVISIFGWSFVFHIISTKVTRERIVVFMSRTKNYSKGRPIFLYGIP